MGSWDWGWLDWRWRGDGVFARFLHVATVTLLLAFTFLLLKFLIEVRYDWRVEAGTARHSHVALDRNDPSTRELLAALESVDENLRPRAAAPQPGPPPPVARRAPVPQLACPKPSVIVREVPVPGPPPTKLVCPEPPQQRIVVAPAPACPKPMPSAPTVCPKPAAQVASLVAPAPTSATQQPALRLQPGLRGPIGDTSGRRIWLSSVYSPGDPKLFSFVAAGDVMMGTRGRLNPALHAGVDAASLVGGDLAAVFRGADVAFVNLEGPLYDGAGDSGKGGCANCFAFRGPEYYADILATLGIDAVSMANNHSGDYGAAGRESTIAALKRAGIAAAGLERADARTATLVLPDGRNVGIAAFAPNSGTLNLNDIAGAAAIIRELKSTHDFVIASFHGGAEGWDATHVPKTAEFYLGENRGDVQRFAHAMVDAGASVVVGHGPHVPRAVEIYRGHLIDYSLGNFWTYELVQNYAVSGLGPVLQVWVAPDGTVAGVEIHSTRQAGLGVPHLDPLGEAARYVMYLTRKDYPATADTLSRGGRGAEVAGEGGEGRAMAGPGS